MGDLGLDSDVDMCCRRGWNCVFFYPLLYEIFFYVMVLGPFVDELADLNIKLLCVWGMNWVGADPSFVVGFSPGD